VTGDEADLAEVRRAIEGLLATYAALIDAGDFDGVAALLAGARITTIDGAVVAAGRDEIAALYDATTRRHGDGTPRTSHLITNLIVDRDAAPGRFVARSYFTVLQATDDLSLQPVIAGRYRDLVERRDDGRLAFVDRCMQPTLFGELRHHLRFDPTPPSRGS
jgi:3-phenylpropionate/cinnamic acid dioxygenase small subunit